MKTVNQQACKILNKLLEAAKAADGHAKIDNTNGAFMPVHVEILETNAYGVRFSVAHYYEQNGDLIADPDMEFIRPHHSGREDLRGRKREIMIPVAIQQSGWYKRAVAEFNADGSPKAVYMREMGHQSEFAGMWMKNIHQQQKI